MEKINKALDYYYKKKLETIKLLEIKTQAAPSAKKRRNPIQKETTEKKDGNAIKSLKKLKIESDKDSLKSLKENKEQLSDTEGNIVNEDLQKEPTENEKSKKKPSRLKYHYILIFL